MQFGRNVGGSSVRREHDSPSPIVYLVTTKNTERVTKIMKHLQDVTYWEKEKERRESKEIYVHSANEGHVSGGQLVPFHHYHHHHLAGTKNFWQDRYY